MKRITVMLYALALLGSANAMAQTNSNGANVTGAGSTQGQAQGATSSGAKQGIEPGKAGDSMNRLGSPQSGASSPQNSLMQKREQGMSPQGTGNQNSQNSSGSMKQ